MAEQHILLGNYEEAKKRAKEAIEIGDHTGKANNIYAAYAQGILADALYAEGDYPGAAYQYRGALRAYEHHFVASNGPEAVELLGSLELVAWTLLSKREFEEAKVACATALGMSQQLLGPTHRTVAMNMLNLAESYMNTGDVSRGPEALLRKSIRVLEGEESKLTVSDEKLKIMKYLGTAHQNLGNLFYLRNDITNAEKEYEQVEALFSGGKYYIPEAAAALKNLAAIRWRKNEKLGAEQLLHQALYILNASDSFGPDHSQTRKVSEMLQALREGRAAPYGPVSPHSESVALQ